MTQPFAKSENSGKSRNMWIVGLAVCFVIGLVLGVIVSVASILPRIYQEKTFAINPVQVSGTLSVAQRGTIQFINDNETASTRYDHHVQLVDGNYSIVLSGGYSYMVLLGTGQTSPSHQWTLYVPSNVTSLTANFQS